MLSAREVASIRLLLLPFEASRDAAVSLAPNCVELLPLPRRHRNLYALKLPVVCVSLISGVSVDAIGE